MASIDTPAPPAHSNRPPAHSGSGERNLLARLWYDKKTRGVLLQILTVALLFAFLAYITSNAIANLELLGKTFSFDFLNEPAHYDINQTLIEYSSKSTHFRAGLVGMLNTLVVAVCGIILATFLGFLLGVLRLSPNWLVSNMVYCYVEFVRNTPVLLQILLVHGLVVHALPKPREAQEWGNIADTIFFTNRGVFSPMPLPQDGFNWVIAAFVIAIVGSIVFARWAKKRQDATGQHLPVFFISLAAIIGLPLIAFLLAGSPLGWDFPALKGFNFRGGFVIRPEFLALWLALSLYTAAFIAEIVRAGILAIDKGQWEASLAVGMSRGRTLNLVIIPQAMRVIVPPLTSQYLNLTKNSSLAIAIGYMDIVATVGGITLMQTGKEMETMIIVIGFYLTVSLSISAVMNWYNKRIKLVER
ncbi:putative glutamine ABC transporter permease protein GlnM [bacterium BMS3Bbin10]|nr:putative glutamine ABC transporter permease protein GlnM [bacterium BMS3Bbin10]